MKLKNLLVEPYSPYLSGEGLNYLSLQKTRVKVSQVIGTLFALLIVFLGFNVGPFFFVAIVAPILMVGWLTSPLFVRRKVFIGKNFDRVTGWYRVELVENNKAYEEQLMEYLEHLRVGNPRIKEIEMELREWVKIEEKYKERKKQLAEKESINSLSRKPQIDEYEKMLKGMV